MVHSVPGRGASTGIREKLVHKKEAGPNGFDLKLKKVYFLGNRLVTVNRIKMSHMDKRQ